MSSMDLHAPLEPLGAAAPLDAEVEAAERRARLAQQVAAVRRRSRMIGILRTVFPAAIIILGVLNFGWIVIQSIVNSMNTYGGNTNEVRMTNPRYYGQGSNGDHYTISGLEAIRKGNNTTRITLKAPFMELKGAENERPTRISAANGVYDQTTDRFTLSGNVVMEAGGSDFTLKTAEAVVDLNKSTISGDKHVDGTGSVGHIEGESFVISDHGRDIVFKGRGPVQVKTQKN